MKRRILALLMAAVLMLTLAPAVFAEDGVVDEENETYTFTDREGNTITVPVSAFASYVVEFIHGDPWRHADTNTDPQIAIGLPDADNSNSSTGDLCLGGGGILILGFDKAIYDGEGNDIYVFEVGGNVEATLVEVSDDLETWYEIGVAEGRTAGLDLNGKVPAGQGFRYVRLTDLREAANGDWPGADIDTVCGLNTRNITVPGAIREVTVTPAAGGKITLNWTHSAGAKTYVVQRHERGSDVWTTVASNAADTTYTDTTGTAGKIYQYRVRGRNGSYFGDFKTSAEVACMSGSTPGAVGTPAVKASSGGKITVSWTAAAGAATYVLQRNERGSSTWTTLASNLTATSYTDTKCTVGKVYRYRVRSRNVSAFGPFKVSVEVAAMSGSAPGAVSNVTVTAAAKQVTVSWGAAEGAATYILQRKERGATAWTTLNSNVKETSYVDTTGGVGAVYQYRVRSRNVSAYGPFKASAEVGFMAGSTPGDISKVTVSASSGKITVSWTASSGAAGYIVQRKVKGSSAWENLSTNVTELSYVDKSVKAGTVYQYRIRPRNGSIYGNFKASAEVTAK